jgi:molecular chaperone HscB
MNYFEVFGLPRVLGIDLSDLEARFHQLSREYHPDYFATSPPAEKQRALRMTALLNDAYRTLRHPIQRIEYLLSLEGLKPDGSKVPQSLLAEVFEINEQLQEVKAGTATPQQTADLREQIRDKRERFDARLGNEAKEWDALLARKASQEETREQLLKLAGILSESSYIRNLEEELRGQSGSEGPANGSPGRSHV